MGIINRRGEYSESHLIICEGFGDARFIYALLRMRQIVGFDIGCPNQEFHGADGITAIPNYILALTAHRNAKSLKSITVVIDADDEPEARFLLVSQALIDAGLQSPTSSWTKLDGKISTLVLLLPENGVQGTLEHLLVSAISETHPDLYQCVRTFAECTRRPLSFSDNKRAKMEFTSSVAAYCVDDPSTSLSYLWSKKDEHNPVALTSATFDPLVNALRSML